jgi:hypothetical protein
MGGQRRRRLDARTWREVLERFAAAGMTVGEFCGRERLSPSSFYRWRDRLQTASTHAVAPRQPRAAGVAVPPSAAHFIELGSLASSRNIGGSGLELHLDLGGGVVLRITRH